MTIMVGSMTSGRQAWHLTVAAILNLDPQVPGRDSLPNKTLLPQQQNQPTITKSTKT